MIRQDFIMRQIQQLIQVLARVLFLKSEQRYDEARDEIHQTLVGVVGRGPAELVSMSEDELLEVCSGEDGLHVDLALALGDLFCEESELPPEETPAVDYLRRALFLYEEVMRQGKTVPLDAIEKRAEIQSRIEEASS